MHVCLCENVMVTVEISFYNVANLFLNILFLQMQPTATTQPFNKINMVNSYFDKRSYRQKMYMGMDISDICLVCLPAGFILIICGG